MQSINLKVGAQIMLVKNLDVTIGLVNGSRGVVLECDTNSILVKWAVGPTPYDRLPKMEERVDINGMVFVRYILPILISFALTIHKIQGFTVDFAEVDIRKAFEYGQVYVALSRVRSLQGLSLLGFNPSKVKCHPDVLSFYSSFSQLPAIDNPSNQQKKPITYPELVDQIQLP